MFGSFTCDSNNLQLSGLYLPTRGRSSTTIWELGVAGKGAFGSGLRNCCRHTIGGSFNRHSRGSMGLYRGYIGIMEKKMEATTWGLGFRI